MPDRRSFLKAATVRFQPRARLLNSSSFAAIAPALTGVQIAKLVPFKYTYLLFTPGH